jgi:hypothetical protein
MTHQVFCEAFVLGIKQWSVERVVADGAIIRLHSVGEANRLDALDWLALYNTREVG